VNTSSSVNPRSIVAALPVLPRFAVTALVVFAIGCSPKSSPSAAGNSLQPLSEDAEVLVLGLNQALPDSCRQIGKIKAGGDGSNCHYSGAIADAKAQARKMGGNIVKITEYRDQGLVAPCYQIKAKILYSANTHELIAANQAIKDSLYRSRFGDHPDYAILYAYRPTGAGALIGYNLHFGDSVICRMKNYSKYEIRLYKEGPTTLWAKTEAKSSVPINVKFGEEYYVKCTIVMGVFVGEPDLRIIENDLGEASYAVIPVSPSH
jgi:hypothetical protein